MATPAPDAVKRLVDRFDQDRKVFLSGDYKEEQLRAEFGQRTCRLRFLNPFFTALGWDMDNTIDTIRARNWGSVPFLRYFPKGTDSSRLTRAEIRRVESTINNRPMKCLGYRTPLEAASRSVALRR